MHGVNSNRGKRLGLWTPTEWASFFGAVALLIGALAAAAVTVINALHGVSNKVDMLQVKVDGRLTQLLERTAVASRLEGVDVGRVQMGAIPVLPITMPIDNKEKTSE